MTQHVIHFYDSATPGNIPSGVYAYAYVNGYAWSDADIERMGKVRRISVESSPVWARWASTIDVETGAASPADVPAFIRSRRQHGYDDATIYVNRSNWDTCKGLVRGEGLDCLWWVATLDGTWNLPGAWAVQGQGGPGAPYDVSRLYGEDWFHRP